MINPPVKSTHHSVIQSIQSIPDSSGLTDDVIGPPKSGPKEPLTVRVYRAPWSDFEVEAPNRHGNPETYTLDHDEVRLWFKNRGANMINVESALDYCMNFQHVTIVIRNPKEPPREMLEPRL